MKSSLDTIKAKNPILEMQFVLRKNAQVFPEIPVVFPTGRFDLQTQNAVTEFQKKFNLPITGKIDFITWNAIMEENIKCIHCINTPAKVACFEDDKAEYKIGDKGNIIFILQILLKNFREKYINYIDVDLTGVFDETTEKAIKQFQKYSGLPVTGILNRQTWNTINKINETCQLYDGAIDYW